jgi:hypothetical protein
MGLWHCHELSQVSHWVGRIKMRKMYLWQGEEKRNQQNTDG